MTRNFKIIGLVALLGVVLVAMVVVALRGGVLGGEKGVPGQTVRIDNQQWTTEILKGEEDHHKFAMIVYANLPRGYRIANGEVLEPILTGVCNAVLDEYDAFNLYDLPRADLEHIDVNLRAGGKLVLDNDVGIVFEDGECISSFYFDGAGEDADTISTYDPGTRITAHFLTYGLTQSGLSFNTTNGARELEVKYTLNTAVGRDLDQINVDALCIHTLTGLSPDFSLLGVPIDVTKYPVMDILVEIPRSRITTETFGPFRFQISDGTCKAPDQ